MKCHERGFLVNTSPTRSAEKSFEKTYLLCTTADMRGTFLENGRKTKKRPFYICSAAVRVVTRRHVVPPALGRKWNSSTALIGITTVFIFPALPEYWVKTEIAASYHITPPSTPFSSLLRSYVRGRHKNNIWSRVADSRRTSTFTINLTVDSAALSYCRISEISNFGRSKSVLKFDSYDCACTGINSVQQFSPHWAHILTSLKGPDTPWKPGLLSCTQVKHKSFRAIFSIIEVPRSYAQKIQN